MEMGRLVLTRRPNESLTIGDDIKVTTLQIKGGKTLVGIKAPRNLSIKRDNMKKHIIKEPMGQDESARDGTFSTEVAL